MSSCTTPQAEVYVCVHMYAPVGAEYPVVSHSRGMYFKVDWDQVEKQTSLT